MSTHASAHDTVPSRRDVAVERSIQKAKQRAELRTSSLIDAALDLVAERNSLEFTVQELVDRTRLSLHAFYQLFASKDALIEAVLEASLERGVVKLRERVDRQGRPIDRLREFVVGYYELATESRQPVLAAGQAFTEFSVHLDHAAPAKAWSAYRPLRILAYELLDAAVAGHSSARPTGDQLWQLVAEGVTS